MKLRIRVLTAAITLGLTMSHAAELPISVAQASSAILGCWEARVGQDVTACFQKDGSVVSSIYNPGWAEVNEWGGTYRFENDRLFIETGEIGDGWIWEAAEPTASCSVLFATRKIFAVYDCTGSVPDTQFRKLKQTH